MGIGADMKNLKSFKELEALKSDGKTYYMMSIKKQWYAVALEDFQVTFLQQHITASAFRLPVDSNKLKTATKPVTVYDFTELDDDQLIHMFFPRQKPYQERYYESTPTHLQQRNADSRTLNDNPDFKKMNPYS